MTNRNPVCVFLCSKENLLSLNALAGAVDCTPGNEQTDLFFEKTVPAMAARIKTVIDERGFCVAAFSFFTIRFEDTAKTVAALRKRFAKNLYIIGGGPHTTALPESTLAAGFDAVCIGEGEETFPELIYAISQNPAAPDFSSVKGIAFLQNASPVRTPARKPADLAKFPSISKKHARYGAIEISRGCPHGCNFCQTTRIFGAVMRHRPISSICAQIEYLRGRGFVDTRIITSNAFAYGSADGITLNLPALKELLAAMKQTAGPDSRLYFGSFPSEVRPEHVTKETVALVKQYAHNNNLVIGAQSASERMLKLCNRHHTAADIENAVKLTRDAGLNAYLDFIFGLPGETEADALATVRFIKSVAGRGVKIHAHSFMPLPGTPYADAPLNHNRRIYEPLVRELIRDGYIYGDWIQQKAAAERMAALAKQTDIRRGH